MSFRKNLALLAGIVLIVCSVLAIAIRRMPVFAAPRLDNGEDSAEITPLTFTDEPSPEHLAEIWAALDQNRAMLREQGILPLGGERIVGFDLPLKSAEITPYNPWFIANYVDQNAAFPNAVTDYACGQRSYDSAGGYNHKGTDFFLWPTPWKQMAEGKVQVVAAAPAVIIYKEDGNYDRQCSITGARWNAVYVEHADGSVGWYGHLKSGSLTTKNIGDTLTRGEFIGLVGSSGNSTGPHLHFEVYDPDNNLIDPYSGSCSVLNDRSWWLYQEPYRLPSITGIVIGNAPVTTNGCGLSETTYESDSYAPNSHLYFSLYYRDRANDLTATVRLLRPDGSEFTRWTHTDSGSYWSGTYTYAARTIGAETGQWTVEVSYNNQTYAQSFNVGTRSDNTAQPTAIQLAEVGHVVSATRNFLQIIAALVGLTAFVWRRVYQSKR